MADNTNGISNDGLKNINRGLDVLRQTESVARKQGARPFFSSHNCISQFTLILHPIFFIIQNIEFTCSDCVLAVVLNFEWMKVMHSYGQY
jgi:hypothetical protein